MKISVKGITGFGIGATDGKIGTVKEIYFEDHTWTVRYLIVKTGNFLKEKLILISTQALLDADWDNELFSTNLSTDQIINSPDIDTDKPVYRQQEVKLYEHFPWDIYWAMGIIPMEDSVEIAISEKQKEIGANANPHLRSSDKVTGYTLHAIDGELGHIDDLIIETESWKITYVVLKTGSWFSGQKILIPTEWIIEINWLSSTFVMEATVEKVQQCEPFDADGGVNEAYEKVRRDYKGRRI